MRNSYKILVVELEWKRPLEKICLHRMMEMKCNLKKMDVRM
jgi:hypothetical protein